jgi:hypothetical protein
MSRLPTVLLALSLAWASAAAATVEGEKACCACKDETTEMTLFCALIEFRDDDPIRVECEKAGGFLLCKALELDGPPCDFGGLDCPVSPAPALAGAPLGTLAVILAVAGFVTLRRRSSRS